MLDDLLDMIVAAGMAVEAETAVGRRPAKQIRSVTARETGSEPAPWATSSNPSTSSLA